MVDRRVFLRGTVAAVLAAAVPTAMGYRLAECGAPPVAQLEDAACLRYTSLRVAHLLYGSDDGNVIVTLHGLYGEEVEFTTKDPEIVTRMEGFLRSQAYLTVEARGCEGA